MDCPRDVGVHCRRPATGGVVHAADDAVFVDEVVHVPPQGHPGEGDVFGDVFDGELFALVLPQEGADDLQGDRVDALVHKLAAALALRGDDLVQLLLVKGFVPGEGLLPGHELLQGGLEAVVVKGLDEVVRHAVGVQLADVPGFAGGGDHDHIGQDALGPEFDEKGAPVHDGHVVV